MVTRSDSCSFSPLKPTKVAGLTSDLAKEATTPRPGFPRRIFSPSDALVSDLQSTFSPSLTRQALAQLTLQTSLATATDRSLASYGKTWSADAEPLEPMVGETESRDALSINAETEDLGETEVGLVVGQSRNFTLSPETTDYDSELDGQSGCSGGNGTGTRPSSGAEPRPNKTNGGADAGDCGSVTNAGIVTKSLASALTSPPRASSSNGGVGYKFNSMPILEDGLSSGHNSDADDPDVVSTQCWPPAASAGLTSTAAVGTTSTAHPSTNHNRTNKRRMGPSSSTSSTSSSASSHYQPEGVGSEQDHSHRHGRSIGLMPALARSPASSSPSTCSSPSGSSSQLKNRHPTGVPSTLIGHHSMPVPTQKHQHQPLWVKKIVSHLDFDASVAPSPLPSSYRKWLTYPIGQCQTIDVFVVVVVAVERFQVSVFFFSSSVLVGSHLPVLPLFIEIH